MLMVLYFVIVGFTVGGSGSDVYLQNDESIYVVKWGTEVQVYVYKYDPVTMFYTGQWINYLEGAPDKVTVHFIEESKEAKACKLNINQGR